MVNSVISILAVIFFIALAGLFAGAETGLYRLSRLRLRLGIEKRRALFVILGRVMHDSGALLLSMLVGTNLSHYAATSIITTIFLIKLETEGTAELSATILTAPILFIFSELIPKNIFFYRADLLMPYLSPILYVFHKLFVWSGFVPLLRLLSGLFSRMARTHVPSRAMIVATQRHQVEAILKETREEGILSPVQAEMVHRIVSIPHIHIRSVIIPINKVKTVDVGCDRAGLLNELNNCSFTRLLVVQSTFVNIIGFINVYEALGSSDDFTNLSKFVKPIRKLVADTTVTDAISFMQRENNEIVLVTKAGAIGREKPIGIVTMKDLVEEVLGELAEW